MTSFSAVYDAALSEYLIDPNPALVLEAVRRCRASLKKPPETQEEFLDCLLRQGLPETVNLLSQWVSAF